MKKGRPKKQEIVLTDLERKTLLELTRSLKAPHSLVIRAGIVLSSADGEENISIARRMGVSMPTIGKWRKRFIQNGLVGLYDESRPGVLGLTMTRKWQVCFKQFWRKRLRKGLIGRYAAPLEPLEFQRALSSAILKPLAYSLTGLSLSSCQTIRILWIKSGI